MSRPIFIERSTGIGVAAVVLTAGLVFGAGAFLGGYVLGERSAPEPAPQTELAAKEYVAGDLEAAMAACRIEGLVAKESSVTLAGADHSPMKRQCFVAEMGATELAIAEYGFSSWGTPEDSWIEGGEYSWSNVHMVWEQTDTGRDVTITVEERS